MKKVKKLEKLKTMGESENVDLLFAIGFAYYNKMVVDEKYKYEALENF